MCMFVCVCVNIYIDAEFGVDDGVYFSVHKPCHIEPLNLNTYTHINSARYIDEIASSSSCMVVSVCESLTKK